MWDMGGYGWYVWSAVGVSLSVLLGQTFYHAWRIKRLKNHVKQQLNNQPIKSIKSIKS